ncbi:Hypothetical predicted protein, partial [Paramuricea clavata]
MASKACGQIDDKQRRYISKIPILSKNYKDSLRNVKHKRLDIERREAEMSLMRKELLEMSEGRPSPSVYLTVDHGDDNGRSVTTELLKPAPASTTLIPSKSVVEPLRSVIITPNGTKRRVAEGKELKMCDLFDKLEEVSPG